MERKAIGTVEDLFPRLWLRPEDLQGRKVTVKIVATEIRDIRGRDGTMHPALILSFERAQRKMICNKTQTLALAELIGSPTFAEWVGHTVALIAATAPNGKPTLAVVAAGEAQ